MLTAFDEISYIRMQIKEKFPGLKWEEKLKIIQSCFSNHRQIKLDEKSGKYLLSDQFYADYVRAEYAEALRKTTNGLAVNMWSTEHTRLLHTAAECGDLDVVKWLIEDQGAEIDCLDDSKRTPLFLASSAGKVEVMEYLISKGADINCKSSFKADDSKGYITDRTTPLHIACRFSRVNAVKLLIQKGAKLTSDYYNETPIEKAYTLLYILDCLKEGAETIDAEQYLGTRKSRDRSAFPVEADLKLILKMLEPYYKYVAFVGTTLSSFSKLPVKPKDDLYAYIDDSQKDTKAAQEFTDIIRASHKVIKQLQKSKVKIPVRVEVRVLSFIYGNLEKDYGDLNRVVAKRTIDIIVEVDQPVQKEQRYHMRSKHVSV